MALLWVQRNLDLQPRKSSFCDYIVSRNVWTFYEVNMPIHNFPIPCNSTEFPRIVLAL